MVGNTLFKDMHKYTRMRQDNGTVADKAMMDYVVVSRHVIRQLDASVLRLEVGGMSNHFLVEGKLRLCI